MYNQFKECRALKKQKKYIHVENDASYYTARKNDTLLIFFEEAMVWSTGSITSISRRSRIER